MGGGSGNEWRSHQGIKKCVRAVAEMVGDLVINGEYWMKSCLIVPLECQEILLMGIQTTATFNQKILFKRYTWESTKNLTIYIFLFCLNLVKLPIIQLYVWIEGVFAIWH